VHERFPNLWNARDLQVIRLAPLPRKAAEAMMRAALGIDFDPDRIAALVERSEGNAFFLEELIRAVAEGRGDELPETVLGMVEARLSVLHRGGARFVGGAGRGNGNGLVGHQDAGAAFRKQT
jgi:hypothetical protein